MSDAKACFGCGNDTEVEPVVECEECALEQVEHARRLSAALAASQARVAELELRPSPEICAENRAEGDGGCGCCVICCDESRKRAEKAEAESAAKDTALNALREALENQRARFIEMKELARGKWGHPKSLVLHDGADAGHLEVNAALSLEAVKLAADAQARRDEAVAEATVWAMISASAAYGAEEGMADYAADVAQHAARRLGVAASTTRLPSRDHPSDLKAVIRAALAKVKP